MGGAFTGIIRAAVLAAAVFWASAACAQTQDFRSWLKDLRWDALEYGVSQKLVDEALPDTLEPNERVLRFDRQQPEGGIPFEKYKKNALAPKRIKTGRFHMQSESPLLRQVSEAYGVEPQYIVALWGLETSFGRHIGGFETIPALVTLAYEGRRGAFFRAELLKALKIVDQGHIPLHEMKGSWAGAMGQCQFMPTSFMKFARDHDGDGKRDIWRTRADVFASTAAYLSESGWKKGQPWGRRVILPKGFDRSLIGLKVEKPIQFWRDAGVRLPDGKILPQDSDGPASIVQPGGEGYKTYIVYGNYRILMDWNASTYFATAVGLFADLLK